MQPVPPKVLIILATFNGASYIREQIYSIKSQIDVEPVVAISDDCSSDGTLGLAISICEQLSLAHFVLSFNIKMGSASANFLTACLLVNPSDFDYFAFCDQDDIWLPRKLYHSIQCMKYQGCHAYSSPLIAFQDPPDYPRPRLIYKKVLPMSFMTQSASAGCTYVLDQTAFTALNRSLIYLDSVADISNIFSHDVYTHQVIKLFGLAWYYDFLSFVLYRQHSSNDWGASKVSISAIKSRLCILISGSFFNSLAWGVKVVESSSDGIVLPNAPRSLNYFCTWLKYPSLYTLLPAILFLRHAYPSLISQAFVAIFMLLHSLGLRRYVKQFKVGNS